MRDNNNIVYIILDILGSEVYIFKQIIQSKYISGKVYIYFVAQSVSSKRSFGISSSQ